MVRFVDLVEYELVPYPCPFPGISVSIHGCQPMTASRVPLLFIRIVVLPWCLPACLATATGAAGKSERASERGQGQQADGQCNGPWETCDSTSCLSTDCRFAPWPCPGHVSPCPPHRTRSATWPILRALQYLLGNACMSAAPLPPGAPPTFEIVLMQRHATTTLARYRAGARQIESVHPSVRHRPAPAPNHP